MTVLATARHVITASQWRPKRSAAHKDVAHRWNSPPLSCAGAFDDDVDDNVDDSMSMTELSDCSEFLSPSHHYTRSTATWSADGDELPCTILGRRINISP